MNSRSDLEKRVETLEAICVSLLEEIEQLKPTPVESDLTHRRDLRFQEQAQLEAQKQFQQAIQQQGLTWDDARRVASVKQKPKESVMATLSDLFFK